MAQRRDIVEQAYDQVASKYDAQYQSPRCVAENLEFFDEVPRRGRVVDVGCGTGLILEYAQIEPERYTGIDISSGMLDVARTRWPEHTFMQADMREMPITGDTQDAVVSGFTAFNYVEEHVAVVKEFNRVLKPGGQVWMVALGPRCVVRDTYALYVAGEVVPRYPVHAERLKHLFELGGFHGVRTRAMTITADKLVPNWAPTWAARAFVRLESRTLGRLMPSSGDFILLSAQKD